MKKINTLFICLLAALFVSCNTANTDKSKETEQAKTEIEMQPVVEVEAEETDFVKLYEAFVSQEVEKLAVPTAETITETEAAYTAFVTKHGDPNAIEMTAEAQEAFNLLRAKYDAALETARKALGKK